MKRIAYTITPYTTVIRLLGVVQNPADGFPARPLDSQPTANVVVTVAGHAGTEVTPNPTSLTFTTSNWNMDQTVAVTAGDDADTENDTVTLTHSAASMDSGYDGITIDGVTVTVNDDDTSTAGICGRTPAVRDAWWS